MGGFFSGGERAGGVASIIMYVYSALICCM